MSDSRLAVIVLAAGQGTRMRSARAKVLHPLAGRPMIGHVLATARELDPIDVLVVVRHQRDAVADAVGEYAPDARIVDQDEIPGTGRAVEQAVEALDPSFDGEVVVISADVPLLDAATLEGLLLAHRGADAGATLLTALLDDATGYGRVIRDADGAVDRIVEHRDASEVELEVSEINSGTYVFSVASLRSELPRITTANAQGEKYLTDAVALIRASGRGVAAVPVAEPWLVAGVNDRVQLSEQAARLNAMIVRRWQLDGVTVLDPTSTWIDLDVTLAEDVELLPNTRILAATKVDRMAVIGPDVTLRACEVGEGARILRAEAELAVFGAYSSVGPFAYVRPGTELGGGGKIGTYVETKNARIGRGTKVPHLSYIGDAEIGEGTNIGAGAITANYDDLAKHTTVIGSHVHTGAHNVFVAPVEVGDGAKVGAGAVVRKDVPPGALAISVAPQRNRLGWTEENRAGTEAAAAAASAAPPAS